MNFLQEIVSAQNKDEGITDSSSFPRRKKSVLGMWWRRDKGLRKEEHGNDVSYAQKVVKTSVTQ